MATATTLREDPDFYADSAASAAVRRELTRPATGGGMWLVASLGLFVLAQVGSGVVDVVVLVLVLFFHEGGHYLAMRAFGYRDLKVFFVPFLGAAASGKQVGVAAWKQAVVSLAGPVPGIVLGSALTVAVPQPTGAVKTLILSLVLINALNLLPLAGLDGGMLFRRILFSRHRALELAFQGVAGLLLILLAMRLKSWPLGVFASLGLLTLPNHARVLSAAARLRPDFAGVTDPAALDPNRWRTLFAAARGTLAGRRPAAPRTIAVVMEALLRAMQAPPGVGASLALAGAWLGGVLIAAVATFVFFARSPPSYWHTQALGSSGLTVEMPYRPAVMAPRSLSDATGLAHLESGTRYWFAASVWQLEPEFTGELADVSEDAAAAGARTAVAVAGLRGTEQAYVRPKAKCRRRVLRSERLLLQLDGCVPAESGEAEIDRFFGSVRQGAAGGAVAKE